MQELIKHIFLFTEIDLNQRTEAIQWIRMASQSDLKDYFDPKANIVLDDEKIIEIIWTKDDAYLLISLIKDMCYIKAEKPNSFHYDVPQIDETDKTKKQKTLEFVWHYTFVSNF